MIIIFKNGHRIENVARFSRDTENRLLCFDSEGKYMPPAFTMEDIEEIVHGDEPIDFAAQCEQLRLHRTHTFKGDFGSSLSVECQSDGCFRFRIHHPHGRLDVDFTTLGTVPVEELIEFLRNGPGPMDEDVERERCANCHGVKAAHILSPVTPGQLVRCVCAMPDATYCGCKGYRPRNSENNATWHDVEGDDGVGEALKDLHKDL